MRLLLFLLVLCGGGLLYNSPQALKQVASFVAGEPQGAAPASAAPSRFTQQSGPVTMYSLSYCGPCKVLAREMTQAGIQFTQYEIDTEPSRQAELTRRLTDAGIAPGRISAPIVFAGRQVFMGATPLREIEAAIE